MYWSINVFKQKKDTQINDVESPFCWVDMLIFSCNPFVLGLLSVLVFHLVTETRTPPRAHQLTQVGHLFSQLDKRPFSKGDYKNIEMLCISKKLSPWLHFVNLFKSWTLMRWCPTDWRPTALRSPYTQTRTRRHTFDRGSSGNVLKSCQYAARLPQITR